MSPRLTIDWPRFARALKEDRADGRTLRRVGAVTDLSIATLCRAEQAREISAENYLTLCRYLGRDPYEFVKMFHGKQSA